MKPDGTIYDTRVGSCQAITSYSSKAADLRRLDRVDAELYAAYSEYLHEAVYAETLSHSYAVNPLSTANVVFEALRRDRALWLSPTQVLGPRSYVRDRPLPGLDAAAVTELAAEIRAEGNPRLAALAELCRGFGLRFREASLLPVSGALFHAERQGAIDVRLGTKNGRGRYIDRPVPVSDEAFAVLERARQAAAGAPNLIPETWQYVAWYHRAHRHEIGVLPMATSIISLLRSGSTAGCWPEHGVQT